MVLETSMIDVTLSYLVLTRFKITMVSHEMITTLKLQGQFLDIGTT